MDRGHGGVVERLFAGGSLELWIGRRNAAVMVDLERGEDHALVAKLRGFGHHGFPVALQSGEKALDVAREIDALRVGENLDARSPSRGRLPPPGMPPPSGT